MCTRVLADFGARVIKVENPERRHFARYYDDVVNGLAAHFVWANRGKESVMLDLKSAAGLDILHRLLDGADVLVSDLAPGSTARLGIAPDLMGYPLTYTLHSGIDQQPLGMSSPAVAPYGAYRTTDNQTVVVGTTNDQEWQRLCRDVRQRDDLADDERFATNAGRVAHRSILDDAIGAWCARHDLEHVQKTADAAGIGNARYNLPSEVLTHPQLTARDRWRQIDTPAGPIPSLLPPPVITGCQPPKGAVPGLGQHTDSVLAELGFGDGEIAALRAQGFIGPAYR